MSKTLLGAVIAQPITSREPLLALVLLNALLALEEFRTLLEAAHARMVEPSVHYLTSALLLVWTPMEEHKTLMVDARVLQAYKWQ